MVMVFDENGNQIPEFQGPKEEVYEKLMEAIDADTKLHGFDGAALEWRRPSA